MRILLVEDDAMIGESVRVGLRRDSFTVDWVRDGRAAELSLANGVYDLVLEKRLMARDQLDRVLQPDQLTRPQALTVI